MAAGAPTDDNPCWSVRKIPAVLSTCLCVYVLTSVSCHALCCRTFLEAAKEVLWL